MASTYSTSLKITLIGDGDQSGIWGQTTNTNLGTLLEQAITGVTSIVMTNANYTLTSFNGVTDEARNAVLVVTGTNSAVRDLIPPVVKKLYTIVNNTTGGFAIRVIGATGTGVNIPNGAACLVYCDGTNFVNGLSGTAGNFLVNGNVNAANLVATSNVTATSFLLGNNATITNTLTSANVSASSLFATTSNATTFNGTTANVTTVNSTTVNTTNLSTSNASITGGTITGITDLAVADGGTGSSSLTPNSVMLGNGTSALSGNMVAPSSSNNVLVSNGSTWVSSSLGSLSVFDKSFSTNGYQKLPGGLIMQWGIASSPGTDGSQAVTFPIAFPNAVLNIATTHILDQTSANTTSACCIQSGSQSTTGFTLLQDTYGAFAGGEYFFAIGY